MLTQIKLENMSDNDSEETDIFHIMVTLNSKRYERPENLDKTFLRSQCVVPLKAEILTLENFVVGEINTVREKLNTSTHPNN